VETNPAGYVSVLDKDGGNPDVIQGIIVLGGATNGANDFLDELGATITGTVKRDTNDDNVGDVPLVGVTVRVYTDPNGDGDPADGAPYGAPTLTDAAGAYTFTVPVGSYVIVETDPSGYLSVNDVDSTADSPLNPVDAANTSPTDNRIPVTLALGETDSGNDFVDKVAPPTAARLDYLRASKAGDTTVNLAWGTLVEFDTLGFKLHRSTAGGEWQAVGQGIVSAKGGNHQPQSYRLTDPQAPASGTLKYRLTAVELSGRERVLAEVQVQTGLSLRSIVVGGAMKIELKGQAESRASLEAAEALDGSWTEVQAVELDAAGTGVITLPVDAERTMRFFRAWQR
jgi:hypothetical protein